MHERHAPFTSNEKKSLEEDEKQEEKEDEENEE